MRSSTLTPGLLLLLGLLLAPAVYGQFGLNLTIPRTSYLALEAIPATVVISNRSGEDLVLGGPGRESWLSFEMADSNGRALAPIEVSAADMVQLAAGETIQRKVIVTDAYAPSEIGNYTLTARVYHTRSKDFYTSNRARFSITDVKPLWERSYGVPKGFANAGSVQRYALLLMQENNASNLYFRLIDDKTGLYLRTYALGGVNLAHDPQITIDRENRLQVLFLIVPKMYGYCIVNPDGTLAKRIYYRELAQGRPRMITDPQGNVRIEGGTYYDPTAPAETPATGRGVSERPPGL